MGGSVNTIKENANVLIVANKKIGLADNSSLKEWKI